MRLAQLGLDVMMGDDLSEAGDDSDGGGAAAPLDPYTAARRLHRLRPEVPPPFLRHTITLGVRSDSEFSLGLPTFSDALDRFLSHTLNHAEPLNRSF